MSHSPYVPIPNTPMFFFTLFNVYLTALALIGASARCLQGQAGVKGSTLSVSLSILGGL